MLHLWITMYNDSKQYGGLVMKNYDEDKQSNKANTEGSWIIVHELLTEECERESSEECSRDGEAFTFPQSPKCNLMPHDNTLQHRLQKDVAVSNVVLESEVLALYSPRVYGEHIANFLLEWDPAQSIVMQRATTSYNYHTKPQVIYLTSVLGDIDIPEDA